MRIERIRGVNLSGMDNMDWTLPEGPTAIFFKEEDAQTIYNLLLQLFYPSADNSLPMFKNSRGLIESWISEDHSRYHISFTEDNEKNIKIPTRFIEDENKEIILPDTMSLGEYLFGINIQAFQQGGMIIWPNIQEKKDFSKLIHNLQQGGDEKFSLAKMRASLSGAQKKVNDQAETMALVKKEYAALRREWKDIHRQQEQKRLRMIKLKNLQERAKLLNDELADETKLQERLAVLAQNSDYRELRQLQAEMIRLEEVYCESEKALMNLTQNSQVDWSLIESLRTECLEWAEVENQADIIRKYIEKQENKLYELETFFKSSGYQELNEDAELRLKRTENDRLSAQKELEKLIVTKQDIEKLQQNLETERKQLQNFANIAKITENEEVKLSQKEQHLQRWKNSKIAGFIDHLGDHLGVGKIEDKLSLNLKQDYQFYEVSNYQEFKIKLDNYHKQQERINYLRNELTKLQKISVQEEKLKRIVISRTRILNQAFTATKTKNFSEWQEGWNNFKKKKQQWTIELEALHSELEELDIQENLALKFAEQLKDKIGKWGVLATNLDQVLAEVLKVARQMRIQEEADRELSESTQRLEEALGDRSIKQLAEILEPLAELERELNVSEVERQARLSNIHTEKLKNCQEQAAVEEHLKNNRPLMPLPVLEKKIEKTKEQLLVYENLKNALQKIQASLELSWRKWQFKYGQKLERETAWILNKISSFSEQGIYFAYRMALAQLAINSTSDIPLFFIATEKTEDKLYWKDILEYLKFISNSRQVILMASDLDLRQKINPADWKII